MDAGRADRGLRSDIEAKGAALCDNRARSGNALRAAILIAAQGGRAGRRGSAAEEGWQELTRREPAPQITCQGLRNGRGKSFPCEMTPFRSDVMQSYRNGLFSLKGHAIAMLPSGGLDILSLAN